MCGSKDPDQDPYQNVTDPQHLVQIFYKGKFFKDFAILSAWVPNTSSEIGKNYGSGKTENFVLIYKNLEVYTKLEIKF
jgi:hypothetical protein